MDPESKYADFDTHDEFNKLHPQLSRVLSYKILDSVYKSKTDIKLKNDEEFAGDGMWCEYAYVIDLDKNTFEIYKFNDDLLDENDRFFKYQDIAKDVNPVRLCKVYYLSCLPDDKEFLAEEN